MPSNALPFSPASGLRDNHSRGKAGDFLSEHITPGSALSFVSAYFTVHAYQALRYELEAAAGLRFLFGEPSFIRSIEKEGKQSRQFKLGDQGLALTNQLSQKKLAKDCADWITGKVEIRSIVRAGFRNNKQATQRLGETEKVKPERDAKLAELRGRIQEKVTNPTINLDGKPVRKVLIFTAFADTAKSVHDQLSGWAHKTLGIHSALVVGDGDNKTTIGTADFDDILTNFSPLSKRRAEQPRFPQDEEIELLIATDCISEGQNLQDCDLLINYDIHWNPVRIIQRFGRIDRIGSRNAAVQLVNFSFVQPKETLLLLRGLAGGHPAAFEKLCDLFDTRTQGGTDMSHYDVLATSALASIERTFQKRAATSLLSSRGGLLPTLAETPKADDGDWELVTWLAVLKPDSAKP